MSQSQDFALQVLGAHVVELAATRVRNAELEQEVQRLNQLLAESERKHEI